MSTTTLVVIGAVAIATVFILKNWSANGNGNQPSQKPPITTKPTQRIDNDKVVVVKEVDPEKLKQAIQQFCDSYNQDTFVALPTLSIISDSYCVITFPYDIDFERFCYFVNFIHYPFDIVYEPQIRAWTTTKQGDSWMAEQIVNKKVMLYIPSDDQEHDNVYLTTSDGIGYKMGFALGEASQPMKSPRAQFEQPTVDIQSISARESQLFE